MPEGGEVLVQCPKTLTTKGRLRLGVFTSFSSLAIPFDADRPPTDVDEDASDAARGIFDSLSINTQVYDYWNVHFVIRK
jgi:hypothetical protein